MHKSVFSSVVINRILKVLVLVMLITIGYLLYRIEKLSNIPEVQNKGSNIQTQDAIQP